MKKLLLTAVVSFCMGSLAMAQQAKTKTTTKTTTATATKTTLKKSVKEKTEAAKVTVNSAGRTPAEQTAFEQKKNQMEKDGTALSAVAEKKQPVREERSTGSKN